MNATAKDAAPKKAAWVPPKVIKRVTLPQMSMKKSGVYYVKFDTKIEHKAKIEKDEKGNPVEKQISVAQVTNLENGEMGQLVVGTILEGNLVEAYPNDSYVGKGFRVEKSDVDGKRYKGYLIDEVAV